MLPDGAPEHSRYLMFAIWWQLHSNSAEATHVATIPACAVRSQDWTVWFTDHILQLVCLQGKFMIVVSCLQYLTSIQLHAGCFRWDACWWVVWGPTVNATLCRQYFASFLGCRGSCTAIRLVHSWQDIARCSITPRLPFRQPLTMRTHSNNRHRMPVMQMQGHILAACLNKPMQHLPIQQIDRQFIMRATRPASPQMQHALQSGLKVGKVHILQQLGGP